MKIVKEETSDSTTCKLKKLNMHTLLHHIPIYVSILSQCREDTLNLKEKTVVKRCITLIIAHE